MDLFQIIADYNPKQRKVLVIDEFPYLVKTNPAFPSILQNAWDELLKGSNVMLILSGSLVGMMRKHGVFSKSGFTQRLLDTARANPDLLILEGDRII